MKYIRLFTTTTDYTTYKSSVDYVTPNVSLCTDTGLLYFELPQPETIEEIDPVPNEPELPGKETGHETIGGSEGIGTQTEIGGGTITKP